MPLYEAIVIASHFKQYQPIRNLLASSANFVRSNGGCVRSVTFHGNRELAQVIKGGKNRQHARFTEGDFWTMHFDSNPPTVNQLNKRLTTDPRVLRCTILKRGESLSSILESTSKHREQTWTVRENPPEF